jgi:hypothetical protein
VKNIDEEYTDSCEWEFPECRESPPDVQALISDCTRGSPDWTTPLTDRLVRVETKLYPKGRTGRNGEPAATAGETLRFSRELWTRRLELMEHFLKAKLRWDKRKPEDGDDVLLGFALRPKLKDVLARLELLDFGLDIAGTSQ